MKVKKLTFITISICVLLFSCGTDEESEVLVDIPTIPSESTFLMDFSITEANSGGRTQAKGNWGRAAVIVGVWSILTTAYTAIPVASFGEAFNHEPTFDASIPGWVWAYDVPVGNLNYSARLESEVTSAGVEWEMYISLDGSFQDFKWYSGTSAISGTNGNWILNAQPLDPIPALEIDWNRNEDGTTKDIKYTNIVSRDENNGGNIFFQITDGTDYNRLYELYQKVENNTITIEWNKEKKNGRVKGLLLNSDSSFHCWGEDLEDIDC